MHNNGFIRDEGPNPGFVDVYEGHAMKALIILVVALLVVALIVLSLSIRVVTQYEKGVLFRLGKVVGVRARAGRDHPGR